MYGAIRLQSDIGERAACMLRITAYSSSSFKIAVIILSKSSGL